MDFLDNNIRFCILYFKEAYKKTVHWYNRLQGHLINRFNLYSTPVMTLTLELRLDTVFQEPIGHFQKSPGGRIEVPLPLRIQVIKTGTHTTENLWCSMSILERASCRWPCGLQVHFRIFRAICEVYPALYQCMYTINCDLYAIFS